MGRKLAVTTAATTSPLISKTGFKGYDYCLNPYVGCGFGCSFCYVRFFIRDPNHDWGEFVRVRKHAFTKLARELKKPARGQGVLKVNKKGKNYRTAGPILKDANGDPILIYKDKRLVIGTMTDPYQPIERKNRVTRQILKKLLDVPTFRKIGIFTRSPIVLEDLDLIKKLPRARIHYSISPFQPDIMKKLEPLAIRTNRRLDTIKKIKDAGIRVHVNVAPAVPHYSESMTFPLAEELGKIGVDEFFVDPVQPYDASFTKMDECLRSDPHWLQVSKILSEKEDYLEWKQKYWYSWKNAWAKYGSSNTLAIWSDHENHVWRELMSGQHMDPTMYGDDLTPKIKSEDLVNC
jgi:DNA repair photolyase